MGYNVTIKTLRGTRTCRDVRGQREQYLRDQPQGKGGKGNLDTVRKSQFGVLRGVLFHPHLYGWLLQLPLEIIGFAPHLGFRLRLSSFVSSFFNRLPHLSYFPFACHFSFPSPRQLLALQIPPGNVFRGKKKIKHFKLISFLGRS